ncbi:MAG: hypothetical protein BGO49_24440 [Planctomycetales bacterium 71-10]|nr:MAG: hypothetical protein BGO49_24440 [Planctomycetales bacterium 71-10]
MALIPAALSSNLAAALELLALGSNVDVVAVYDGFTQVFAEARPMKASVRETSRIMEHPAENGVIIADHHVINPVEVDLSLLIPVQFYGSTYAQIRQAFANATNLSVQTKTGVYLNMVIADMPHEENPDLYDAIAMLLRLKQVLLAPGASTYSPADPANLDLASGGLQSAAVLGRKALAAATSIASYADLGRLL